MSALNFNFGRSEVLNNLGIKFGTAGLVHRKFAQKLIHDLESNKELQTPFVLDGPSGIGKSFTLRHILEHFKNRTDHFIVEIPSAADWLIGKYPYKRLGDKWEQPFLTSLFFKGLLENNEAQIDKFHIKVTYDFGTQKFQKDAPFSELLHFGSTNFEKNSEAAKAFFNECKKERNLLVTVDKVNSLYSNSGYFTEKSEKIHSSEFILSRELLALFHSRSHAKVVGASTKSNHTFNEPPKGVALIAVPKLSDREINEFLNLYRQNLVTFRDENINRLQILSDGNPRKLYALCRNPLEL